MSFFSTGILARTCANYRVKTNRLSTNCLCYHVFVSIFLFLFHNIFKKNKKRHPKMNLDALHCYILLVFLYLDCQYTGIRCPFA